MAEVLREYGYTTFAVGKWHLVSMENSSSAGPFDQWPLQRGFDRYYGFLDGETDQFAPDLTYDNHRVERPKSVADGYHLSEDSSTTRSASSTTRNQFDPTVPSSPTSPSARRTRPTRRPVSTSSVTAAAMTRAGTLLGPNGSRDKRSWYRPEFTELAPRNDGVEPWDELPEVQKKLAARLQEAYAAFLEHTDAQIGRLVADLKTIGELDNTLILLMSDNGASQEGGPFGVLHEMKYFNMVMESPEEAVQHLDDIGDRAVTRTIPGLGPSGEHALQVVQAEHARRRRARTARRPLAEGHRRARRSERPVPLRDRHRTDRLRGGGRHDAGVPPASNRCRWPACPWPTPLTGR